MIKGSLVALVTPMHTDGSIDFKTLENLVTWHLTKQTDGLVILGTTGESPTVDYPEQEKIIGQVVQQVAGKIPVIVGTGTNSTTTTLKLTQKAKQLGADAALIIAPYYNKPPQEGLYQHYKTVAEQTHYPIILYNHPGRTGVDILPETVARLAKVPNIVGIKEGAGQVERIPKLVESCGSEFAIYSGDDDLTYEFIRHGAHGVISVTANIAPQRMHDFCQAMLDGNTILGKQYHDELYDLHKKLFLQTNPIPVKWALEQLGLIASGIRLPLLPFAQQYQDDLKQAMHNAKITI